jgi:hypothetical protein
MKTAICRELIFLKYKLHQWQKDLYFGRLILNLGTEASSYRSTGFVKYFFSSNEQKRMTWYFFSPFKERESSFSFLYHFKKYRPKRQRR